MGRPRHIIFDLDGTLVDSSAICTDILNAMLRERGSQRVISPLDAKPYLSRGGLYLVTNVLGEECGNPDEELLEFRRRYAESPTPANSMYEGVYEGLHELADLGFKLAICSNKPQFLCDKVVSELGLARIFSVVVGTSQGRRPKPDPHLVQVTLAELGATAAECLYVGDSELDALLAAVTEIPFLFVTYGYCEEVWEVAGAAQFDRFRDVVVAALETKPPLRRVA
jgi:phosphoglycolate phosphatase